MLRQPGLALQEVRRIAGRWRYPPIALTQHADEEGACAVDLGQADRQNLAALGLFGGDAPAQVDIDQFDEAVLQARTQFGEDPPHQQVALLGEVAEGATEKDADGARVGHEGAGPVSTRCLACPQAPPRP